MAVQKSKKSRAKRGTRRNHHALNDISMSIDATTGEKHRRHHVTDSGFYRGQQVISERPESTD